MKAKYDVGSTDYSLLESLGDLSNRDAWTKFLGIYGPMIRNRCLSFGLDAHTVEDLEGEIRFKLLEVFTDSKKRFQSTFRGYLEAVIRNAVMDYFRQKYSEKILKEVASQRYRELRQQELRLLEVADEFELLIVNRLILLDRAMAQVRSEVTKIQWEMFHAFVFQGKSASEVAKSLNRTFSSVYKNRELLMQKVIDRARAISHELQ